MSIVQSCDVAWLNNSLLDKDFGVLIHGKLNMNYYYVLTFKNVNSIIDCINQSRISSRSEVIILFFFAIVVEFNSEYYIEF